MTETALAFLLSVSALHAHAVRERQTSLTAPEVDRLVAILRAPLEDPWKAVAGVEEQRRRLRAFRDALETMRTGGREPLAFVTSWWRILQRRRAFPSQARLRGKLVSRPFSGYHLSVPASYDAARPTPLVICLHPGGGFGGRRYLERFWASPELRESAILFAPDWPEGGRPRWSRWKFLHLAHVFQEFNIDRNRVFLDGAADGGTEAWRLASSYAYLFAGLIIRAGPPPPALSAAPGARTEETAFFFKDLKNTRVLFFNLDALWHGLALRRSDLELELQENTKSYRIVDLDPHTDPQAVEDAAAEMRKPVLAFVRRTCRNPYPRFIDWTIKARTTRRAYWIRSLDEEPLWADPVLPGFTVELVDRVHNRIEIRSRRIRGFEISLNDLLVDLDRPVTIVVNGKTIFFGQPARSLDRIFRSVAREDDWTDVFPWVVRIEVPTR